jgi:hypothetical protein
MEKLCFTDITAPRFAVELWEKGQIHQLHLQLMFAA